MKIAVYFCKCGSINSDAIDVAELERQLAGTPELAYLRTVGYLCAEDGKQFLERDLVEQKPDRVVVAACSPREYETTFRQVLESAGLNGYFLQMVNIREQLAWVTPDRVQATAKAAQMIRGAIARVAFHRPLHVDEVEASPDVLVIGAGPAGLKAALTLAEAGRHVVLVEKQPVLGGLPVRFEELFPTMECGPCMLEPVLGDVMHGKHAENIEVLTLAQVTGVTGYLGNFTATIVQRPRFVDETACIGCGMCVPACKASTDNEFNCGLDQRRAIALPFAGALPNAPFIDASACIRFAGQECSACRDACPVEGVIRYDGENQTFERMIGAIVVAMGSTLYDCSNLPALGYGKFEGVYTSMEFERLLASNGPTAGVVASRSGDSPRSIALIHCVGSLDPARKPYCSGICCEYAFKFNVQLEHKLNGAQIHHFYKELALAGKQDFALYDRVRQNPHTCFTQYRAIEDLSVVRSDDRLSVRYQAADGRSLSVNVDMVVLCPAIVPAEQAAEVGRMLEVAQDAAGFFEEMHGKLHSTQSKVKGIYIAGTCQAPGDLGRALTQGTAAAGYVLSELVSGRKLQVDPTCASVYEERCSGCRICGSICPYKAISHDPERGLAQVNALLCHGCGTCVAACPAGALVANHFSNQQILAEQKAVLS